MKAVYETATGRILSMVQARDADIEVMLLPGQAFGDFGDISDATHYVSGGVALPFPARPSANHDWNWTTHEWFDARALADVKAARVTRLRRAALVAANANLTAQNVTFEVSPDIRAQLAQELALAQAEGASYSLTWERADGSPITLTGNQVRGLLRAISNRDQSIRAALRAKLVDLNAAPNIAAADGVIW